MNLDRDTAVGGRLPLVSFRRSEALIALHFIQAIAIRGKNTASEVNGSKR